MVDMMITDTKSARLLVLKHALKLEILGMKRRGRSVYSIIKEEFNLKGSKQRVWDTFKLMIETIKQEQEYGKTKRKQTKR